MIIFDYTGITLEDLIPLQSLTLSEIHVQEIISQIMLAIMCKYFCFIIVLLYGTSFSLVLHTEGIIHCELNPKCVIFNSHQTTLTDIYLGDASFNTIVNFPLKSTLTGLLN